MSSHVSRRQFSLSSLGAAGTAFCSRGVLAGKPGGSSPQVSTKPYPPLAVAPVPEAFEDRYADLGGVLDLTNGVVWGYEPFASLVNAAINYSEGVVNERYLWAFEDRAAHSTPEEHAILAEAQAIAAQFTWRWPTVFEARDAVAKGLFTFGEGGVDMYYGSPLYAVPAVSYGVGNLRWSSSEAKGLVHAWSAADGGTRLITKTSTAFGIVVTKL